MRRAWLWLLLPVLLPACATQQAVTAKEGPPVDLKAAYREALLPGEPPPALQGKPLAVGPEAPYVPIMLPPEVRRVWVPDHLNEEGDLVSGHWVYLLLSPSKWFLEAYPPAQVPTLRVPVAPEERPPAPGPPKP